MGAVKQRSKGFVLISVLLLTTAMSVSIMQCYTEALHLEKQLQRFAQQEDKEKTIEQLMLCLQHQPIPACRAVAKQQGIVMQFVTGPDKQNTQVMQLQCQDGDQWEAFVQIQEAHVVSFWGLRPLIKHSSL